MCVQPYLCISFLGHQLLGGRSGYFSGGGGGGGGGSKLQKGRDALGIRIGHNANGAGTGGLGGLSPPTFCSSSFMRII